MKRMLMAEQWDKFARAVMPANVPTVQRREMRRAFYAGGEAILFRVMAMMGQGDEPTAEDLQIMTDLYEELRDFSVHMLQGRA